MSLPTSINQRPEPVQYQHGLAICPGHPLPFGASLVPGGINFSFYSRRATACTLVLFETGAHQPFAEIVIPDEFRIGEVFAVIVLDIDADQIEYGFRIEGDFDPEFDRFNPNTILLDPYARAISGRDQWGQEPHPDDIYPHRARVHQAPFDWGGDRLLSYPIEDVIIYEMHVRGFTRHATSGVSNPGTFDGIREKIPYLKSLGINCIELMPIFEFDEFEHTRVNEETGERLLNYWGYSPVGFFAPKDGYGSGSYAGAAINELKNLVKDLHANGIEIVLDVVFNHTAEGNHEGPTISFKGIDNSIFYILTPEGYYYNFSGTGNTLNCNHPRVRPFIIDCLRYWVTEYHIDGFRFDLASIMTRDVDGTPLTDPPLLREIIDDPILGKTKLIAEPWDADGLYHLGSFPAYGRWAEWNGQYRDVLRRYLKGDPGETGNMAYALQGSPNFYPDRGPIASINFITSHDGFTLQDLVSYNQKHNEANLENNNDGQNENFSWNCGAEGPTDDPAILALRDRQVRNALTMLLVSQGTPMLLMGDEVGRSQQGNNNAYCHDTELAWLDWSLVEENKALFTFVQNLIAFRMSHSVLRNGHFLRHEDYNQVGFPDMAFHGLHPNQPGWSRGHVLAFSLGGDYGKGGLAPDNHLYVAMNMHWQRKTFHLPTPPGEGQWYRFVDTADARNPSTVPGQELSLKRQDRIRLQPRSVMILVWR
ncbi:MAG: glycogen debranching enzyme GlgX [Anaerolineaceae bacterium]|nr:glycogen debranching enzyme GlgX [Anaerolineaceae bacterium]